MARLPIPGADKGTWGDVLNDYLSQTLNADGTLKAGVITATKLDAATQTNLTKASTSVQIGGDLSGSTTAPTVGKLQGTSVNASTPSNGQVLQYSSSSSAWIPGTVSSTTVTDAAPGTKGIVSLNGDLAGTASAPTIASTANVNNIIAANTTVTSKAADNAVVHLAGTETISGAKTFSGAVTHSGTTTVATPTADAHAATKLYVDNAISGGTGNAAIALSSVAVKSASYTATVNTINPIDATSAAVTVTLPATPADKSRIVIKKIDAGANIVTIATGTGDVLNKASGATTVTLQVTNQALQLQYASSGAIWYVVSADVPSSALVLGVTKSVTSTYTLVNTDHVILADASSAAFTVTLPTAVAFYGRFTITAVTSGNNVVTVGTTGSQTISGGSTVTVGTQASGASYSSLDVVSDGANWRIV